MADNAVPTLTPERPVHEVLDRLPAARPHKTTLEKDKEALFQSIAQENIEGDGSLERTPFKTFFTGLLWTGYAVAIVVALVLVWSAAGGMLKTIPR